MSRTGPGCCCGGCGRRARAAPSGRRCSSCSARSNSGPARQLARRARPCSPRRATSTTTGSCGSAAMMRAGEAMCLSGEYAHFADVAQRALGLRQVDEPLATQLMFDQLAGLTAMYRGDYAQGVPALRRVLALADELDEPTALIRASTAAIVLGDDRQAYRLAVRAAGSARSTGDLAAVPQALELAAAAECALGRYDEAGDTLERALPLARETGQDGLCATLLGLQAVLAATIGDRDGVPGPRGRGPRTHQRPRREPGPGVARVGPGRARPGRGSAGGRGGPAGGADESADRTGPAGHRRRGHPAPGRGRGTGRRPLRRAARSRPCSTSGRPIPATRPGWRWRPGAGPWWPRTSPMCTVTSATRCAIIRRPRPTSSGRGPSYLFGQELRRQRHPGRPGSTCAWPPKCSSASTPRPLVAQARAELRAAGEPVDRHAVAGDAGADRPAAADRPAGRRAAPPTGRLRPSCSCPPEPSTTTCATSSPGWASGPEWTSPAAC